MPRRSKKDPYATTSSLRNMPAPAGSARARVRESWVWRTAACFCRTLQMSHAHPERGRTFASIHGVEEGRTVGVGSGGWLGIFSPHLFGDGRQCLSDHSENLFHLWGQESSIVPAT